MASTALLSNFNGNITLTNTENYLVGEGITHYRTISGNVLTIGGAGENDIFVSGTMTTVANGEIIRIASGSTNNVSITIAESGSIMGSSNYRGISSNGDYTLIANNGLITGGEAVLLNGQNATIRNTGTIQNTFVSSEFQAWAVQVRDINGTLQNSGDISGGRAVNFTNGGNITNSGTITATDNALELLGDQDGFLVNTGSITSTEGNAVVGSTGDQDVSNSGMILGNVDLGLGNDTIYNTGTIIGDVETDGGANEIFNTGTIDGTLTLGVDGDLYSASGDGIVSQSVNGGTGNDTLLGAEADDVLNGEGDIDLIFGNSGEDQLNGGDGNDFLYGGADDDTINGGADNDVIRGNSGNDELLGAGGADKIFGGAGDDEITGGGARDVMRGNGGADVFIFTQQSDSTTAAADRIRDFQSGVDLIDISAIEDFTFVGDNAFSGTQAEVRFQTTASGLRFEMDVDGNGTADMRVNMNNVSTMVEADFIL